MRASYSASTSAAAVSLSSPPASYLATQILIRLRLMPWRLASAWGDSPPRNSWTTCRLNSIECVRCLAMGFLLESPVQLADSQVPHLSIPRGALQSGVKFGRRLTGKAEAFNRPVEIGFPIRLTERQTFTDRRLIDLDDPNSGLLQVYDFIAKCERDLAAGLLTRNVVADEGPLQHCDGSGQHALHGQRRQRLGVGRPFHGHRMRTRHVAIDNRGTDTARTVALHPAMLGEVIARELLAEILHHVVALELAMNEH